MRVVVQRVSRGAVIVEGETVGEIGNGFVLFLGIREHDAESDLDYLVNKVANLRVFPDKQDKMNLSLLDIGGELLVVSQFTLYGDCRKGRRPSFVEAAEPLKAQQFYNLFVEKCKKKGIEVKTGQFQAMMEVEIHNEGPVTLILDSNKEF